MKPFPTWRSLSVGGVVLALAGGCNSAQKQHAVETECTQCAAAAVVHSAPVYTAAPPAMPAPAVPHIQPQPLPPASEYLPSVSAKFNDTVRDEPVKRRSYGDITADPKFSHAADYTWLVGKLQYVHGKDQWRVRFTSVDEEDRYGGSVTLQGLAHRFADFKDGQMVRVEGQVVDADSRDVAPAYRMMDIQNVE